MSTAGVDASLAALVEGREVAETGNGGRGATHAAAGLAHAGGLDGEGLAHDGAALAEQLEAREGASAGGGDGLVLLLLVLDSCSGGRAATGRGREGAEGGGRSLLEERAHGLGLAEDGVHGGSVVVAEKRDVVLFVTKCRWTVLFCSGRREESAKRKKGQMSSQAEYGRGGRRRTERESTITLSGCGRGAALCSRRGPSRGTSHLPVEAAKKGGSCACRA